MKENTFTPLLPDQIEAVEKFLVEQDASFDVITEFRGAFSTPPEPEYIPGRWYYFKDRRHTWIARCASQPSVGISEDRFYYSEYYSSNGLLFGAVWIDESDCKGPATPEQIQHHLSLAAEKKGIKPGVRFRFTEPNVYNETERLIEDLGTGLFLYDAELDGLYSNKGWVYLRGTWAEIVQEEKAVLPKDYVDMSSVTISVDTLDNPSPIIGQTTDDTEQSDHHLAGTPHIEQEEKDVPVFDKEVLDRLAAKNVKYSIGIDTYDPNVHGYCLTLETDNQTKVIMAKKNEGR